MRNSPRRPFVAALAALRLPLALLLLLAAGGCSSFDREWASLAERPAGPAPEADGITGRWEGRWNSVPSGHEGKLRCIVSPTAAPAAGATAAAPATDAGSTHNYLFRFSATWGPGIISEYDIAMTTRRESPTRTTFEGLMSLGLFGEYQCKGHIQGDTFHATYTAEKDHGTFEMKRPE